MGFRIILLTFSILAAAGPARARECPVTGADATMDAIAKAPTCAAAAAIYGQCSWGSSMDVQFGARVVEKCEAEFAGRLSRGNRRAYDRARKQCIAKYAHREGTLYLSHAATCAVDVAKGYAKRFGKPKPG